tara:strand:+ start:209 stop:490 length:282 start_codon:yes stop_codon:yes gene_type:complete
LILVQTLLEYRLKQVRHLIRRLGLGQTPGQGLRRLIQLRTLLEGRQTPLRHKDQRQLQTQWQHQLPPIQGPRRQIREAMFHHHRMIRLLANNL